MLRRTKYSRLHNDSLASSEDRPQKVSPLMKDLCSDSGFALLDPGTADHREGSIPCMGKTGPQSVLRGQKTRDQTTRGHDNRTDWDWRSGHRLCEPPSSNQPLSGGPAALSCTKRPITLQRMTSLPSKLGCSFSQHTAGLCYPETAAGDLTTVQTANGSVHHNIKYLGNVEVTRSMRTLDADARIQLTREAISRLCERMSVTAAVKMKRPGPKHLSAVLGGTNLHFSGIRVILTVSTDSLTLIVASSLQKIAHHPVKTISFASGGDPETADYIAYVAKDIFNLRACHILECPRGRASEVINSIGRAFERRFHTLLRHTPALLSPNTRSMVRMCHKRTPEDTNADQKEKLEGEASSNCHKLNLEKTPPFGLFEHLQLTEDNNRLSIGIQKVSLYENCPAEGTSAPPAESQLAAEELIQDQGWYQGRSGQHGAEALLTCAGHFLVRERSSASSQYILGGLEGGTVHRH